MPTSTDRSRPVGARGGLVFVEEEEEKGEERTALIKFLSVRCSWGIRPTLFGVKSRFSWALSCEHALLHQSCDRCLLC